MNNVKYWSKKLFVSLLVIIMVSVFSFSLFLESKISSFNVSVRDPIKNVLIAVYMSEITGEYWENVMVEQYRNVVSKNLPEQRFDFYLAIIVHTKLETSKAMTFSEIVYDDRIDFAHYLGKINSHKIYKELNSNQINDINLWKKLILDLHPTSQSTEF